LRILYHFAEEECKSTEADLISKKANHIRKMSAQGSMQQNHAAQKTTIPLSGLWAVAYQQYFASITKACPEK
jgi:hypothetical protein